MRHAAAAAAAAALAAAVASASLPPPAWLPVGAPLVASAIQAAAIDFDDASGAPLLAYAYASAGGGSSIDFLAWEGARARWVVTANHTPQFAQDRKSVV